MYDGTLFDEQAGVFGGGGGCNMYDGTLFDGQAGEFGGVEHV